MDFDVWNIPVVDSHLHLWHNGLMEYPWLNDLPEINKTFLSEDFKAASRKYQIEKMIFVQCECRPDQYLDELKFVESQIKKDVRIQGIVAYAPMERGETDVLKMYQEHPLIKGVRRMYGEDPGLCSQPEFLRGLRSLPSYDLSFDISIKPTEVGETLKMIRECPETVFVLDHLGKPDIRNNKFDDFRANLDAFAKLPNVTAKLSGLITEADKDSWTVDIIRPYVLHAVETFGPERLMFGGDWPVVLLSGNYEQWMTALMECLDGLSLEKLQQIFSVTATRIYKL